MLSDEIGTASRIKNQENKNSVLSAITSTQQRLKRYKTIPENGLIIFCGFVSDNGKTKKINFELEPFKPMTRFLYMCDKRFHTECLDELFENDEKIGFIVMDGNGCLYGTVQGNHKKILYEFKVDLPNKHRRGGQSALRFSRLRMEARTNYVRKVAEMATKLFIENDKPNVKSLVLCGSADFKSVLETSSVFDMRLKQIVIQIVDVSYGGKNGFNQSIELSSSTIGKMKFILEKKLLQQYFSEIATDSGKYCFMVDDTMNALFQGSVETLIVWDELEMNRIIILDKTTNKERIVYTDKDVIISEDEEVVNKESLIDFFIENYKKYGCKIEIITNSTQESSQFCRGFGGVGGILRWRNEFITEHDNGDDVSDY